MGFWAEFVPQLLATTVGAAIGIVGVVLAFHLERRVAATEGFETRVERLLERLGELAADADAWEKVSSLTNWARGDRPPAHPHVGRVSIAIETLKLHASREDIGATQQISSAWDTIAQARGEQLAQGCGLFATAVVRWRLQAAPAEFETALRAAEAAASVMPDSQTET